MFQIILGLVASLFMTCLILRRYLEVVLVSGDSMSPMYQHGDRVLISRLFSKRCLRKQCVIIFSTEGEPLIEPQRCNPLQIKQIVSTGESRVEIPKHELLRKPVLGLTAEEQDTGFRWHIPLGTLFVRGKSDNSIDSTVYGPISIDQVTGVVLGRIFKA